MKYEEDKSDILSPAVSPPEHTAVAADTSPTQNSWNKIGDSDAESQWSASQRCLIMGLSSASGSLSTITSLSLSAVCLEDDDEDNVVYPPPNISIERNHSFWDGN